MICKHCFGTGTEIDTKIFGELATMQRRSKKLSQQCVASRIGISVKDYYLLEHGKKQWDFDTWTKFQELFGFQSNNPTAMERNEHE